MANPSALATFAKLTKHFQAKYSVNMDNITSLRRSVHREAEVANTEYKTQQKIVDFLLSRGATSQNIRRIAGTGVICDLFCPSTNPSNAFKICIRADIDALPQIETTNLSYACKTGASHSCGHDGHLATLSAAGEVFIRNQHKIPPGKVLRLLFQPAEENFKGAEKVIHDNGLDGVSEIYALHNHGSYVGTIKLREGAMFSGVTHFKMDIKGKSTHGSFPEEGHNPLTAMAYIHTSLHTLPSLCPKSGKTPRPTCTIGQITGGTAFNIIPETASMEGSLRTFDRKTEEDMLQKIENVTKRMSQAFGCKGELKVVKRIPPVINHKGPTDNIIKAIETIMGKGVIKEMKYPEMSSEDFALYTERVPGAYFFVGGRDPGKPLIINHSSDFDYNDKIIAPSALIWIKLVEQRFGMLF